MMILSIIDLIDWAQFGLPGVTFITICTIVFKLLKALREKDKSSEDTVKEMRIEMLKEIEKRDERFITLQEKTLKVLREISAALEDINQTMDDNNEAQ